MPDELSPELTRDQLFDGRLAIWQHRRGYRFSVDAVLLANFVSPRRGDRILDLGAGCGVVSLILACRHPSITCTALELQPALFSLLAKNIEENCLAGRINPILGDLRLIGDFLPAGSHDLVVANPPYRQEGSGRRNPEAEQAVARHELTADLASVVSAAAFAIRTGGRAAFVYPAARIAALLATLRQKRLEPKRLRVVYGYPGGPGRLVLVEAVKNGGEELSVLPPFFIHLSPEGGDSPEMAACYLSPIS